jgi:quercetin 2,3-dioxygenase
MLQRRPWTDLGGGDFGWLKAKHHFAFAGHGNPAHGPLGSLIVWNDDEIAPGTGFPLHAHSDMEIITYVRKGSVAGTGIQHAEFNPGAEPLKLYQIWIRPRRTGGKPRWETRQFPKAEQSGRLVVLASGFQEDKDALPIRADTRVFGAVLAVGDTIVHSLAAGRQAYLALAAGAATVNGSRLVRGDGIAIVDEAEVRIGALQPTELVLVDTT